MACPLSYTTIRKPSSQLQTVGHNLIIFSPPITNSVQASYQKVISYDRVTVSSNIIEHANSINIFQIAISAPRWGAGAFHK